MTPLTAGWSIMITMSSITTEAGALVMKAACRTRSAWPLSLEPLKHHSSRSSLRSVHVSGSQDKPAAPEAVCGVMLCDTHAHTRTRIRQAASSPGCAGVCYCLLTGWLAACCQPCVLHSPGFEGQAALPEMLPGGQWGIPGLAEAAYPGGLPPWRLAEGGLLVRPCADVYRSAVW
jgi:hypothetical protein